MHSASQTDPTLHTAHDDNSRAAAAEGHGAQAASDLGGYPAAGRESVPGASTPEGVAGAAAAVAGSQGPQLQHCPGTGGGAAEPVASGGAEATAEALGAAAAAPSSGPAALERAAKRLPTLIPGLEDFDLGSGSRPGSGQPGSILPDPGLGTLHTSQQASAQPGAVPGNSINSNWEPGSGNLGAGTSAFDWEGDLQDLGGFGSSKQPEGSSGGLDSTPEAATPSPLAPSLAAQLQLSTSEAGSAAAAAAAMENELEEERRINLAASDDGAAVIAANKEARYAGSAIDDDGDSYVKNLCSANKWLLLELSQLGRVDAVELTNREMYSSRVRDFIVKGRQGHPKRDGHADYALGFNASVWKLLGNFSAANTRGTQAFTMPPPRHRARYLLVQFLSHYGSEEVCALNQLRVLGVTAAQELEAAMARHMDDEGPEHQQHQQHHHQHIQSMDPQQPQSPDLPSPSPTDQPLQPPSDPQPPLSPPTLPLPPNSSAPPDAEPARISEENPVGLSREGQPKTDPMLDPPLESPSQSPGQAQDPLVPDNSLLVSSNALSRLLPPKLLARMGLDVSPSALWECPPSPAEADGSGTAQREAKEGAGSCGGSADWVAAQARLTGGRGVAPGQATEEGTAQPSSGKGRAADAPPDIGHADGVLLPVAPDDKAVSEPGAREGTKDQKEMTGRKGRAGGTSDSEPQAPPATGVPKTGAEATPEKRSGAVEVASQGGVDAADPSASGPAVADGDVAPPAAGELGLPLPARKLTNQTALNGSCIPSGHGPCTPAAADLGGPATAASAIPAPLPASAAATAAGATTAALPVLELPRATPPPSSAGPSGQGSSSLPLVPPLLPAAGVPAVSSPSLDGHVMSMWTAGAGSSKGKQAGNLFDIFKQEFLLLKLNQSRMTKYMAQVVQLINRNAGEMLEQVQEMEDRVEALTAEAQAASKRASEAVAASVAAEQHWARLHASLVDGMRSEVSELREQLLAGLREERRVVAIVVGSCAAVVMPLLLAAAGMVIALARRKGRKAGTRAAQVSEACASDSDQETVRRPPAILGNGRDSRIELKQRRGSGGSIMTPSSALPCQSASSAVRARRSVEVSSKSVAERAAEERAQAAAPKLAKAAAGSKRGRNGCNWVAAAAAQSQTRLRKDGTGRLVRRAVMVVAYLSALATCILLLGLWCSGMAPAMKDVVFSSPVL